MKTPRKDRSKGGLSANVSTLKTHLGRYLKRVREGEEVIVYDRQLPVAKLIQFEGAEERPVERPPTISRKEVARLLAENDKKYRATKLKRDSLFYLNEDRGSK